MRGEGAETRARAYARGVTTYRTGAPSLCVVCGARAEAAHWANAWERSLGVHPCCSDACAKQFDPDRHWMPSLAPRPLDDAQASDAVARGKARMAKGDDAGPVARDLLMAGVPPWMVRNAVIAAGARARRSARELAMLPLLTLGAFFAPRTTDHDATTGHAALDAVAAWERRFGDGRR